jgi:hypothetical protein
MVLRSAGIVTGGGVVAVDRRAARAFAPSPLARVFARLRGRALDRALIDGADPAAGPQLAAHAARLTARSTRARVARTLERLSGTASEPPRLWGVLPSRRAIAANADELRALAVLLRGTSPLYAQGIAMLRILVSDGTGPVYTDPDGQVLAEQLFGVRRAIAG